MKIPRRNFQRNTHSSLLFEIPMMSLNFILRTCAGGYKPNKLQVQINHMDNIKNGKRIGNPSTGYEDKQFQYRDGIWHGKMFHGNNEKQKTANDGRNRTTKTRINRNARRKVNLITLRNIGNGDNQKTGMKEKN